MSRLFKSKPKNWLLRIVVVTTILLAIVWLILIAMSWQLFGLFRDQNFDVVGNLDGLRGGKNSMLVSSELPKLMGYEKPMTYLVVFQNTLEIRPTGGFIGSYGLITVENGKVADKFTDDIYNLDKFSEGKLNITPPLPMQKYNNQKQWYLRDANWSPDWPTSAEKILWFYEQERINAEIPDQSIDGVIAITPQVTSDLLKLTGPITALGRTYTAENFAWDLERFVEFDYRDQGIPFDQRKGVISEISNELINRLEDSSVLALFKLWPLLKRNLDQKHILVYLLDPTIQKNFSDNNWAGSIASVNGDYLWVVDANLAALKTDGVMDKNISYDVYENDQGELVGKTVLNYKHTGEYREAMISKYRSYVRIYVPKDSWFISAYTENQSGRNDLEITKDFEVGDDLGRRYGATLFTVDIGQENNLVVEYRLPESVQVAYKNGLYNLFVQKQSGTVGHNLEIDLNFSKSIVAYLSTEKPTNTEGNQINWVTDLVTDRNYIVKF
jgi:hypothetical protein